jgi:hypothetical protein
MGVHIAVRCSIPTCSGEATRWFDTAELWGLGYPLRTFYLCEDHIERLAPDADDGLIAWLDPVRRRISTAEVAIYSCSPRCADCNR